MKVKMLKDTNYKGFKPAGSEPEVDNQVALRWINKGIAEPIGPIVVEDDKKEHGGNAGDGKYAGMKAKELYEACKERGIDAEPKKPIAYYIELLELDDATKADDVDEDIKEDAESGEDAGEDGKEAE